MRLRDLALHLDSDERIPRFQRVARALVQAIRQGRLLPGQALPGTRALAEQLAINRTTVIQAIQEMEAEGWVITEPNRGTYVAQSLPEPVRGALRWSEGNLINAEQLDDSSRLGFDLPSRLRPLTQTDGDSIDLTDGVPDASLAPLEALGKASQRALQRNGEALLRGNDPLGNLLLRQELIGWLSERRGLRVNPDQILITRGNRATLSLMAASLLDPGDGVAVEDPGNRIAWEVFEHQAGLKILPISVDRHGMDTDALGEVLRNRPCKAVYVTPQRQYPTTVALSAMRRSQLLDLAASHRLIVIEEDHDADYAFGELPQLPLASQDTQGVVLYTTSLGRLIAPELRLNCIVGPAVVIERLARVQRNQEWQGDHITEWAVADLMRDGDLARHLRRVRKVYQARMSYLVTRLRAEMGAILEVREPDGGLALWVGVRPPTDADELVDAARFRGIILRKPEYYSISMPYRCIRMGFSQIKEEIADAIISKMKLAIADIAKKHTAWIDL